VAVRPRDAACADVAAARRDGIVRPYNLTSAEFDMKSILDPSFRYVSSSHTDLRKTFARIRREQAASARATAPSPSVVRLDRRRPATLSSVR
jgi:hypothetical protein